MGRSMCGHLLAGGHGVQIYSRTRSKAEDLIARGAPLGRLASGRAGAADVVFTMVGFPSDVREVYFGESGDSRRARARHGARRHDDDRAAPGGRDRGPGAAHAARRPWTRRCRAAMSAPATRRCRSWSAATRPRRARVVPLFELMGKNIVHQGGPGAGQHTKMCNQIVIAGTMIGVVREPALCARGPASISRRCCGRSGAERRAAGRSRTWRRASSRGNFDPGFFVEHFIKDMGIALDEARRMNLRCRAWRWCTSCTWPWRRRDTAAKGTHALMLGSEDSARMRRSRRGSRRAQLELRLRHELKRGLRPN